MLSWLFSWLWDNLTDVLMLVFVFCQVMLLYQQYQLSRQLVAKTLEISPQALDKRMKQKPRKRRKRVKDQDPESSDIPEECRRCKYLRYYRTAIEYDRDSDEGRF